MSYKKKESYGTVLGGCLSCFATAFIMSYVILVLIGLIVSGRNIDS